MLDHQYFKKVGTKVRDKYRTHIFTKAKDVYGSKFKGYKEPYKTLKQSGKLKRQSGSSAGTTAPIVTTDLLRDFGTVYKTSSTGFQMGWSSLGARVEYLKKMGRVLTAENKALPDSIANFLEVESDKYIKKKLGPDKIIRHKR